MPSDRLFGPSLTTRAMAAAVSDTAWLAALLRFESALASVQARAGLIPPGAAQAIVAACEPSRFDVAAIGRQAVASATPVLPLVEALRDEVGAEAAPFVHYGATSQDALDTAMMLVARRALDLLLGELRALAAECAALASRHRDLPMAGRTLLQRARPTTFGLKAAGWLAGVLDAHRRLSALRRAGLAVQLGGAVGTLDRYPETGLRLTADLAGELNLAAPELPWHSQRGRVAELGSALAIAAGTTAKIALDVALLAQPEVGEVAVASPGRSSAMPEKRNPARAVEARAASAGAVAQAGVLLSAMVGEHERSAGAWQSEWAALSEAFRLAAGAVDGTLATLRGLSVDGERMRANATTVDGGELAAEVGAAPELVDRALAAYARWEARG